MNKLVNILKQKNGMTLVETVVTFIIAGILIAITGALIITGLNLFGDTAKRSLDKQIADSVVEVVRNELLYSISIDTVPMTVGNDETPLPDWGEAPDISMGAIFISDDGTKATKTGRLYKKIPGENTVIDFFPNDDFYSGRTVEISYVYSNPNADDTTDLPLALTINVKVYSGDERTISRSRSINLMNVRMDPDNLGLGFFDMTGVAIPGYSTEWPPWENGPIVMYMPI